MVRIKKKLVRVYNIKSKKCKPMMLNRRGRASCGLLVSFTFNNLYDKIKNRSIKNLNN